MCISSRGNSQLLSWKKSYCFFVMNTNWHQMDELEASNLKEWVFKSSFIAKLGSHLICWICLPSSRFTNIIHFMNYLNNWETDMLSCEKITGDPRTNTHSKHKFICKCADNQYNWRLNDYYYQQFVFTIAPVLPVHLHC